MVRTLGRALAVLLLVLMQGCVEDDGGDDQDDAGGGPISNNNGNGGATGSPIDIPAIVIAEGQPLDSVRAQLEEKLRETCSNGDVCLDIQVSESSENHETCQYSGFTDPPAGTQVEEGDTVTLLMGSKPCTDANGDGVSDDNDGDGFADDTDGDGTPDVLDDDLNGDGIPDAEQT